MSCDGVLLPARHAAPALALTHWVDPCTGLDQEREQVARQQTLLDDRKNALATSEQQEPMQQ
jgi:hypothetical protein